MSDAVRISTLDKRTLIHLCESGHLRFDWAGDVNGVKRRRFKAVDIARLKALALLGKRTSNKLAKALSVNEDKGKDLIWLRASDKYLPKLGEQLKKVGGFCKSEGIRLRESTTLFKKELNGERKWNRKVLEEIVQCCLDRKIRRIFCWDRSRIFRGSGVQFMEVLCRLLGIELVIVEDKVCRYSEEMKVRLDEWNEMNRFNNAYGKSIEGKIAADNRKERKEKMAEYVGVMEKLSEAGDMVATVLLKQYRKGYCQGEFVKDFIEKANGGGI